jgi:LmbE family N-acetylglucosaminyl deacetylase
VNILVVAPHPDDEALGCGGAIAVHADRGDRVVTAFLTSGELGVPELGGDAARRVRESEAADAAAVLGLADLAFLRQRDWFLTEHVDAAGHALAAVVQREQPELVFAPHPGEPHPDHAATVSIVRTALACAGADLPVLGYEIWAPVGSIDDLRDISPVMDRKLDAIRCYRSQIGHFRYDRAIEGLNRYRGELVGRIDHAEVFETILGD